MANPQGKRQIQLGIIVGKTYTDEFLSLDEYVNHYLLPFSPRFRMIDFAVASLASVGIDEIFIFTDTNKEYIPPYLTRGWPDIKFTAFDTIDITNEFHEFFQIHSKENKIQSIAMLQGDYPVWFDMNQVTKNMGRHKILGIHSLFEGESIYPGMVIDRNSFLKRLKIIIDSSTATEEHPDFNIPGLIEAYRPPSVNAWGYFMPLRDLQHYYDVHMDMLDDFHFLDHFNGIVPVKSKRALSNSALLQKGSHIINSLVGEHSEVQGKIKNSVVFSHVKIDPNSEVENSLILPGNHIGRKTVITNAIIDEFSSDNTLPNIEKSVRIGGKKTRPYNKAYPDKLRGGFTLVGKDVLVPSHSVIGSNCYIDSFIPHSKMKMNKELLDGDSIISE